MSSLRPLVPLVLVLAGGWPPILGATPGHAPPDLYQVDLLPGRGEARVRFTPAEGGETVERTFRSGDADGALRVEPGNSYLFPESLWDRFAGSRHGPFRIEVTTRGDETVRASGRFQGRHPAADADFVVHVFTGEASRRGAGLFVITAVSDEAGRFPPPPPWVGDFMTQVLAALQRSFGPLPGPAPGVVVVDFPGPLAKSYPGTVVLDRRLARRDRPPPAGRVAVLAHEVAHQWWPNAVPVRGAGAGTLQEGLAEYGACRAVGSILGPAAAAARWAALRDEYMLASETLADAGAGLLHADGGRPYGRALRYARAAWVIRMLAERVGEEAFRAALTGFLVAGETLSWHALTAAAAAISGEDLEAFRRTWIEASGHPDPRPVPVGNNAPPRLENRGRGGGEFPVGVACAGVPPRREVRWVSVPPGSVLTWPEPLPPGCQLQVDPRGVFLLGPRGPAASPGLILGRAWGYPVVRQVEAGSAAERAGLRPGDLLMQAGSQPLDEEDVADLLGLLVGPEEVRLRVRRGSDVLEVRYRAGPP